MRSNWFYGRQTVREILKSGKPVLKLLIATDFQEKGIEEIVSFAQGKKVPIERVSKKILDSICHGNHQGVAAESGQGPPLDFKSFLNSLTDRLPGQPGSSNKFVSLLDEVQDPQNVGAIIRSAVCFGCSGVIVSKHRSAPIAGGVMKSSSGAANHIPIVQMPSLTVAIERFREKGFFIYGADPTGAPLSSIQFQFPLAIVLGNEHCGIRPTIKKACDFLVAIPQRETIASLNVSTAAAIFFYEVSMSLDLR